MHGVQVFGESVINDGVYTWPASCRNNAIATILFINLDDTPLNWRGGGGGRRVLIAVTYTGQRGLEQHALVLTLLYDSIRARCVAVTDSRLVLCTLLEP